MLRLQRYKIIIYLTAALTASSAAAETGAEVSATAESLFREGKELMAQKQYTAACAKLEASLSLEPALGTLLNLASCHELEGRTASAWAEFLKAGAMARSSDQPNREEVARERARALEPKLTRLQIVVPPETTTDGLEVYRDGVLVERAAWGSAIPLDPGKHTVVAKAPGKKSREATAELIKEGETVLLTIEPLEDAPPPPMMPPPETGETSTTPRPIPQTHESDTGMDPMRDKDTGSTQRTVGLIVGAAGLAGLAAGTVFGAIAQNEWATAEDEGCTNGSCPTSEGQQASEDANKFAGYGTIGMIGGGALFVSGILIYVLAPSADSTTAGAPPLRVDAQVAKRSAGFSLAGSF